MSEEQLTALIAKLKDDTGLQEKFKYVTDIDVIVTLAKEAGFDVSKANFLRYQAKQTLELSDEQLEAKKGVDVEPLAATGLKGPRDWCVD